MVLIGLQTLVPAARADSPGFAKPYFAATKPGSFARYQRDATDTTGRRAVSQITMSRLPNEGDHVCLELHNETSSQGKTRSVTMKFVLRPGFDAERNLLAFAKHIERSIVQQEGKPAMEMPAAMLQGMGSGLLGRVDYEGATTAKGSDVVDARPCDLYSISGPYALKVLMVDQKGTFESEICLSEAVPFGRLKETSTTKDPSGKTVLRAETRLVEVGTGATSRITGAVLPSAPKSLRSKAVVGGRGGS